MQSEEKLKTDIMLAVYTAYGPKGVTPSQALSMVERTLKSTGVDLDSPALKAADVADALDKIHSQMRRGGHVYLGRKSTE